MGVTLTWNKPLNEIAKKATGGDKTALFTATALERLMNPFVPYADGTLADTAVTFVRNGVGYVHYVQSYAHKEYTASHVHRTERHPLASSFWDRAAMQVHKKSFVNEVQAFIERL